MVPTIVSAGNVLVPAFLALLQRGYSVRREASSSDGEESWFAENAVHRFIAEDPVTLLALVALFETRGANWAASDHEIDRFLAQFPNI